MGLKIRIIVSDLQLKQVLVQFSCARIFPHVILKPYITWNFALDGSIHVRNKFFHNSFLIHKGIVHQFWKYNIFLCLSGRNIFCKMSISIKQLLTRNNWENRVLKISRMLLYILFIYNTDWLWAPYLLN